MKPKIKTKKLKKGFTFLELMLVLAALGILYKIISPNFAHLVEVFRFDSDIQSTFVIESAIESFELTHNKKITTECQQGSDIVKFLTDRGIIKSNISQTPQVDPTGYFTYVKESDGSIKVKIHATLSDKAIKSLDDRQLGYLANAPAGGETTSTGGETDSSNS